MLQELSDIQETYKSMIQELRSKEDKSFEEAVTGMMVGSDDEALIAVACVHLEMSNNHAMTEFEVRGPEEDDLLYAQEFLDHLDTLGKIILPK